MQRSTGARDKAFLIFDLDYTLPDQYLRREQQALTVPANAPAPTTQAPAADPQEATAEGEEPLWIRMWRAQTIKIGIAAIALAVLTATFFFQNVLVRRAVFYTWVRCACLLFVLVWLGWCANAQLSVVNGATAPRIFTR